MSVSKAAQQITEANPLDFVPDKIPFDTPYGPAISLERARAAIDTAVAESKKRDWKMNVAVVDPTICTHRSKGSSTPCAL